MGSTATTKPQSPNKSTMIIRSTAVLTELTTTNHSDLTLDCKLLTLMQANKLSGTTKTVLIADYFELALKRS